MVYDAADIYNIRPELKFAFVEILRRENEKPDSKTEDQTSLSLVSSPVLKFHRTFYVVW
jgi:hypothetical protein